MPHYHNFGWYYFVKYVLGFAGMLFLYSGLLKENKFTCVCPAVERTTARRKEDNNESSPTGDRTDASAQTESSTPSSVDADVRAFPQMPEIRRKKVNERSVSPRNVEFEFSRTRELGLCKTNFSNPSSSDGEFEIRDRKKHRPGCRRASKHWTGRNLPILNAASSQNSMSIPICPRAENNDNNTIFDAVGRANLRVRNLFAAQEDRELEALACSIFSRRIPNDTLHPHRRGSPKSRKFRIEDRPSKICEINNDRHSPEYRRVRRKLELRGCRKHCPEISLTPVASLRSRSGSVYLTATSSRGPRAECKIHGRRYCNNIVKSPKRICCSRVTDKSDPSRGGIPFAGSVDRRKIEKQRITRYKSVSTSISMM